MTPYVLQKYLTDLISSEQVAAERTKHLNVKLHFVPLNTDILIDTIGKYVVAESEAEGMKVIHNVRSKLIKSLKGYAKIRLVSKNGHIYHNGTKLTQHDIRSKKLVPALVEDHSGSVQGLLATSYNAAQSNVIKLLNDMVKQGEIPGLSNITFDAGHTVHAGYGFTAPSSNVANKAIDAMNSVIGFYRGKSALSGDLADLQLGEASNYKVKKLASLTKRTSSDIQEFLSIHTEYASLLDTHVSKNFMKGLLSVSANLVFIQESGENQTWGRTFEASALKFLRKALLDLHFSKNFKEEAISQVVAALTNKPVKRTSKTISTKTKIGSDKKATIGNVILPKFTAEPRNPATNRKLGPSLASLQLIINQHLPHVISANMGDQPEPGGQRRILNYRTGRFANSAEVERLTMSKDGMVTAFYSYMKNPYATFSEGGRQYKSSRDPKKLISESIHEIARQYVGNRMRAVVV